MPRGPSADRSVLAKLSPDAGTTSTIATFSTARQGVAFRVEDCGPRREGAAAPTGRAGYGV
jgi:hypothetical protein